MTVEAFKSLHNINSLPIQRGDNSGKLSAKVNGKSMRVQQDIDFMKPMAILAEGGDHEDLDSCCLVNVTPTQTYTDVIAL